MLDGINDVHDHVFNISLILHFLQIFLIDFLLLLFESIGIRREGINGRKTSSTRGAYKREVIGRGLEGGWRREFGELGGGD